MEKTDNAFPVEAATPARKTPRSTIVCFTLAALGFLGFGLIACAMARGSLDDFDRDIALDIRAGSDPDSLLAGLMVVLSAVGSWRGMAVIHAAGLTWQLLGKRWILALAWALIPASGAILNVALKNAFERPRPPVEWRHPKVDESSQSFPSGHAMGAGVGMTVIGYMLCLATCCPRSRVLIVVASTLIALGIGLSRVYLRAHWFSDVMAGFLAGGAWAALCLGFVEMARARRGGDCASACPR